MLYFYELNIAFAQVFATHFVSSTLQFCFTPYKIPCFATGILNGLFWYVGSSVDVSLFS